MWPDAHTHQEEEVEVPQEVILLPLQPQRDRPWWSARPSRTYFASLLTRLKNTTSLQ